MNELPLVSIAIPAFNPEFFSRALHSAITQRYANVEVVVCDDSQGDEIKAIFDLWAGQATGVNDFRGRAHNVSPYGWMSGMEVR